MPGKKEILAIYERQAETVYRVCYAYMKNVPEAEDMMQETFLRLLTWERTFENERHEKAWLIVTASNLCKNQLKKWWRHNVPIEDYLVAEGPDTVVKGEVLDAIFRLPNDYKIVVYMHYYEGYTTAEIARHLKCAEGTVRSRLSRARKQLQMMLGGVADDE